MIEPVALGNFFLFFFDAALVILAAFCYAVLYALGRLQGKKPYLAAAAVSYGILAMATAALAVLGNLNGMWRILAGLLLVGYGLAPLLIWRLCVATHETEVD